MNGNVSALLAEVIAALERAAGAGDGRAAEILGFCRARERSPAHDLTDALARVREFEAQGAGCHAVARVALEIWPDNDRRRLNLERQLRRRRKFSDRAPAENRSGVIKAHEHENLPEKA